MKESRRDWWTAAEVGAYLGRTAHQARHLARIGRVRAKLAGKVWLFYFPSVAEYRVAPKLPGGNKPGWLDRKRRADRKAARAQAAAAVAEAE